MEATALFRRSPPVIWSITPVAAIALMRTPRDRAQVSWYRAAQTGSRPVPTVCAACAASRIAVDDPGIEQLACLARCRPMASGAVGIERLGRTIQ